MIELLAFGSLELDHHASGSLQRVLAQPKRAALLAYLALARPPGFHRRDELLSIFWAERDASGARNALSRSLSFLRNELPDPAITVRGVEEVGVDTGVLGTDVARFEEALGRGRVSRALELYRGPFLNGLHVSGAPEFERWVDRERERFRELASEAAWKGAHDLIRQGIYSEAERMGQRALYLSPTDESAVQTFLQALAPGDRAAAFRFFNKFSQLLAEELELEPSRETRDLANRIRNGRIDWVSTGDFPKVMASPPSGAGQAADSGAESEAPEEHREPTLGCPGPECMATVADHRSPEGRRDRARPSSGHMAGVQTGWWLRYRSWKRIVPPFLAFCAILAGYGWLRDGRVAPTGSLMGDGVLPRFPGLVVADFHFPSEPELGPVLAECLKIGLDQSDLIRPVSPGGIADALRRMGMDPSLGLPSRVAHQLAARDGHPLVVVASMAEASEGYLITARLEAAESREVLGRFGASAEDLDGLLGALDRLARDIRKRIGESQRSIRRSPPLEQVTTSSFEALRLFSDAVRLGDREGRFSDAIPLLEQAIRLDPSFASAYRKLSVTLSNLGVEPGRWAELNQKAYDHRQRLSEFERLQVEATYSSAHIPPNADECDIFEPGMRLYGAYVKHHPQDSRPLHMYGYYLTRMGRRDEAGAVLQQSVDLGTASNSTFNNLYLLQLRAGDRAAAAKTLEVWRDRFPASPARLSAVAVASYVGGRLEDADSIYADRAARFGPDPEAFLSRGKLAALEGRMDGAMAYFSEARDLHLHAGRVAAAETVDTYLALLRMVTLGDTAGALHAVESTLSTVAEEDRFAFIWGDEGLVYALAGRVSEAQQALDTLESLGGGNWSEVAGPLRATVEAALSNHDAALQALADAEIACSFPESDPRVIPLFRGRVYESQGRLREAAEEYGRFVDGYPGLHWDSVFLVDTLVRLSNILEGRGDLEGAIRHLQRATDLWRDADPVLQPRVQAMRLRLEALKARV